MDLYLLAELKTISLKVCVICVVVKNIYKFTKCFVEFRQAQLNKTTEIAKYIPTLLEMRKSTSAHVYIDLYGQ